MAMHNGSMSTAEEAFSPCGRLPAVISAYSIQLRTVEVVLDRGNEVVHRPHPVTVDTAEALTEALLSCHSLRRLLVSDEFLSSSAPAPPVPAWLELESLELDVIKCVDEVTLGLLLDAAPHLQELTLHASDPPCDVILSARCHELRTLVVTLREESTFNLGWVTVERWVPPSVAALPHLTTLLVGYTVYLPNYHELRLECFAHFASYLVHSAPCLRYLHLPFQRWMESDRELLSLLGDLTQLKALTLGPKGWMQQQPLDRYWKDEKEEDGETVQRVTAVRGTSVWGDEALPKVIRQGVRHEPAMALIRGGVRCEEEVLADWMWTLPRFREEVDGTTGAAAFFAAI